MRRKYIALFELHEYINQFPLSVPQFPQYNFSKHRLQLKHEKDMKWKKKEIKIRRGKDNTFVSYSGSILLNRYTYI